MSKSIFETSEVMGSILRSWQKDHNQRGTKTMPKPNRVHVENMTSNAGNKVANQFEIITDDGVYFQSYRTVIAFKPFDSSKPTLLDYAHNMAGSKVWSVTTTKYRNKFLGGNTKEIRERLNSGVYQLAELN